jgi:serine/threonine protein kinase
MAMIDSPHLIRYITSFYGPSSSGATQSMYIVMQHADGGSLAELLRRCKQYSKDIPEAQVWKCMIQICLGLAAMHEHRVVHRDIKPGNILICGGDYKIADLGIATDTTSVQGRMRTHKCGTPCYMAPEVSNDMPYDGRADVWSLGCLLYEMCTLCLAFPEGTVRDTGTRAESGQPSTRVEAVLKSLQLPEAMSDELNDHVMWCLTSDPAERPTPAELLGTRMCSVKALELPSPATRASTDKDGEERKVLNGDDAQCVQGGVKRRQRPVSAPIRRGGGAGGGGGGGQPPKAGAVKD